MGQLRAERSRYEKALRREVGEDVPLYKVLDEASDWRGRAQQITLLQERLLILQESQACPCYPTLVKRECWDSFGCTQEFVIELPDICSQVAVAGETGVAQSTDFLCRAMLGICAMKKVCMLHISSGLINLR